MTSYVKEMYSPNDKGDRGRGEREPKNQVALQYATDDKGWPQIVFTGISFDAVND